MRRHVAIPSHIIYATTRQVRTIAYTDNVAFSLIENADCTKGRCEMCMENQGQKGKECSIHLLSTLYQLNECD